MLYVVALPLISEADDTALRRLRAQYHPAESEMIGPHFTLVFGVPDEREASLLASMKAIVQRPFWFMIDRVARFDLYLFAEPSDGAAKLAALHEALVPGPVVEAFEPHITLGLFQAAGEAESIARIVERQHLPIRGRIEELALVRRVGDALETLETFRLN